MHIQKFMDQQAASTLDAFQGAMQLPPIIAGHPVKQPKRREARVGGERVAISLVRISASGDTVTEKTLGECIIKAVATRCSASMCRS